MGIEHYGTKANIEKDNIQMKNDSIQYRKELRTEKIKARNSIPLAEREALSRQISERIFSSTVFQQANRIMLYRAVRGEVDLTILAELGESSHKQILYPLCINDSEMIALLPEDEHAWQKGFCGIMEPIRERSVEILPEQIDLVICPCTVFDEAGGRMGMGAGFYDRFLAKCHNACVAAAAFEVQKIPAIPRESWDREMDIVFTEKTVYHRSILSMKNVNQ